jgi:tetratricopeptide (TPR) repeat protein
MRRAALIFTALVLIAHTQVNGQFWDKLNNPKIQVTLRHPPGLGLNVKRIAFGPSKGYESDQLTDALTQDFVQNGIEVVDRGHLQSILAEHDFSMSGYVDQTTAAALGKILGPTALIFVNLQRNKVERQQLRDPNVYTDRNGYKHIRFISRTQAFLKASIQTIDLATGRIFQAVSLEANPLQENESFDQCCAEYPPESELQDRAMRQVVEQVHRQFLPWDETRKLYFFDDKDCDLKVAFSYLKGGNVQEAARQSEANLEKCKLLPKGKEKVLARAHYNLGMSRFLLDDYDRAMAGFSEAQRIKTMDITVEAMTELNRARVLSAAMRRVEERMALEASLGVAPSRETASPAGSKAPVKGGIIKGSTATAGAPTPEERLKKVENLFRQKLITKSEYDAKRAEILKEM